MRALAQRPSRTLQMLGLVVLVAAMAALVGSCDTPTAQAETSIAPAALMATLTAESPDSLYYTLTWQPAPSDVQGAVTQYQVGVTRTAGTVTDTVLNKLVTGTSVALTLPKPAVGATVSFKATVCSYRAQKLSKTCSTTSWSYTRPVLDPPPPGSVTVDSSRIVVGLKLVPKSDSITWVAGTRPQLTHCVIYTTATGDSYLATQQNAYPRCQQALAAQPKWGTTRQAYIDSLSATTTFRIANPTPGVFARIVDQRVGISQLDSVKT
jgi:hypothetical protein